MKSPPPPPSTPYLNRRDQLRMLAMVGLLCLVMVAIKLAARPSSWHWLLPPEGDASVTASRDAPIPLKELDFRVHEEDRERLPPDVFRAVADNEENSIDDVAPEIPKESTSPDAPADVTIAPELLSQIEDNTLGVRRAEVEAYLTMLDRVRRLPADVVKTAAADDVAFTVIMLQSEDYRGKLISVTGRLHRLTEYPVMENDRGLTQLYEGWLFTGDSGNNPWRIVCSQLSEGVPLGDSIDSMKVRVRGYFFKRLGYPSEGGQHVAPTLLAASFDVLPAPVNTAPQMQAQMRNWMLGFIGLVIAGLAGLMWWFLAADRRYAHSHLKHLADARLDANPDDLAGLAGIETQDADQLFTDGIDEAPADENSRSPERP